MKKHEKQSTEIAFGALTAAVVFTTLTLLSGMLCGIPGSKYGEGLAVMSAKLNFLFGEHDDAAEGAEMQKAAPENIPYKQPPVSPKLARELLSLSGFGGWDIESAPEETEPKSDPEELPADDYSDDLPYPTDINSRDGKIVRKTYTYFSSETFLELPGGGLLRNCTDIDGTYLLEQASRAPDFSPDLSGEPFVLIMHTHTTESYEPYIRDFYDEDFTSRTTELEKSVTEVGERIAEQLKNAGIGVIHDTTVHDYPRYTGAYDRSAETVREYLEKYPSIKIVIDVHRDALEEDGVRYAPAVDVSGRSAAQVMIICGCTNVPQYRYNLRIASRLQSQLESDAPGITRPILFDERNYNQEMTHGSFLIEMGSNANSLDEALYSGEIVGKSLAEVIKMGW